MGEFFVSLDSNEDGIEEVFVGGTSVTAAGGTGFTLVNDTLLPILRDDGSHLDIVSGSFVTNMFNDYGCANGQLVQILLTTDGLDGVATRTSYRIEGPLARTVEMEEIEFTLNAPVEFAEEVWDDAPTGAGELSDCYS